MENKPDKLKEIRDRIVKPKMEGASHTIWWEAKVGQIQSETYQLADKEWQAKYDLLQSKYDLLVEDKLDMKQLGREEVIREIEEMLQSLIPLLNNEFGQKLGTIMLVIAKLKELK